jgi:hypothetical protein
MEDIEIAICVSPEIQEKRRPAPPKRKETPWVMQEEGEA